MRIYVSCLASYNAGISHGCWIDLKGLEPFEVKEKINQMLSESSEEVAEDWAIHDYDMTGLRIGEHESLETICHLAKMVESYGAAYVAYQPFEDDLSFEEAYRGTYSSPEDWAESYLTDVGLLETIPEALRYYFDMRRYALDSCAEGMLFLQSGSTCYVFQAY